MRGSRRALPGVSDGPEAGFQGCQRVQKGKSSAVFIEPLGGAPSLIGWNEGLRLSRRLEHVFEAFIFGGAH